jgi:C1A family cysteine protease
VSYTKKVNGLIQASAKDKAIANKFSLPKFHWVKDKPDSRDYLYQSTLTTKSSKVDLRPFCTPIEDQGNLGSCTGQAIAGAIEYLNKKAGKTTDISRLFIYYYERAMINTVHYDSGAYIRDGIKVVYKNGAPLEKFWPYNIRRFTQSPSAQAITDAKNRKVSLYERITTLDGCINALSNGFPVTVGFYVYNSFTSRQVTTTGIMPYPNVARERLLGGHAVLLVGYDNTTNRFIARNSWGSNWGDRGYFYMPYQVIDNRSMSDDFWVIRTVNNPR